MNSIKHRMYHLRQTNKKPKWLGQAIYDELKQIFLQDAFKKESERNKKNRASDCDGQGFALHVGGCVSHSEHIDRMMAKQGHQPTIAETFMHLRSKIDSEGNVKWVNERAQRTHEEFTTKFSQVSSQSSNGDDILSTEKQIKIFSDVVGGPRKGVIYGLAGQDYNTTHGSSSSNRGRSPMEWESERTQMLEQLNEMKSSINEMQTSFESRVEAGVLQRLNAEMEERMSTMEAKLMARFTSFHPQSSRSLPSNQ